MTAKLTVHPYTTDDYDDLLIIQKEAFPPPFPEDLWWSRSHIEAHEKTFPDGTMLARIDGEPAGSATSLITDYDGTTHTWEEAADNGFIRKSHHPEGDTLYGIDVCVRPRFRGKGVAGALYEARKNLVKKLGLKRYIAGCRIPGYHLYADKMTADEYVEKVASGHLQDQVLSFMLKQGLTPLNVIPDYLDDDESHNYAVMVEWRNPEK